ncbi:MAG: hypothetical protein QJR03_15300 [Sphaerobacter sp.]|nr:hypothetical protein [Sphaerobacter sp.]
MEPIVRDLRPLIRLENGTLLMHPELVRCLVAILNHYVLVSGGAVLLQDGLVGEYAEAFDACLEAHTPNWTRCGRPVVDIVMDAGEEAVRLAGCLFAALTLAAGGWHLDSHTEIYAN